MTLKEIIKQELYEEEESEENEEEEKNKKKSEEEESAERVKEMKKKYGKDYKVPDEDNFIDILHGKTGKPFRTDDAKRKKWKDDLDDMGLMGEN